MTKASENHMRPKVAWFFFGWVGEIFFLAQMVSRGKDMELRQDFVLTSFSFGSPVAALGENLV